MALELDLDPSSSSYISALTSHRHLPGRGEAEYERPFRHSDPSVSTAKVRNFDLRHELGAFYPKLGLPLQPHQLAALEVEAKRFRTRARRSRYWGTSVTTRPRRDRAAAHADEEEGRALAAASCHEHFPGDGCRRRTPSLERQDAYCEERRAAARHELHSDAADDSELVRLGLLYDDEQLRGSGFSVRAIEHGGNHLPYSVRFRPARQRRARKVAQRGYRAGYCLPLDLSFSALEDDQDVARYLISPDESECDVEDVIDEPHLSDCGHAMHNTASVLDSDHWVSQSALARTIYSLQYDSHAPAAHDFPELVSDKDTDTDDGDEWQLVEDKGRSGGEVVDHGDARDHPDAAWVVLD